MHACQVHLATTRHTTKLHQTIRMPPINVPVLPRPVQLQIDALRKQYHGLDSLITRLMNLSGGTLAVQQELARNAREESKAIESKIEVWRH